MSLPTWRDWLFSAKAFGASLLALYIALAIDLQRPYWAMTSVYIVAHPLTGATSSKALYRTAGTLLGATVAVALVPALVNVPELLSLAVAAWVGCLFYLSLLDRTPRSYVFMLAGYTLPLIALSAVSEPRTIFDVALARSEEIGLGILCASAVGATVFPASVSPVLADRISRWLRDAGAWAGEILSGKAIGTVAPLARQRLAADIADLDALILQLGHDPEAREASRWAKELRGRLLLLLPVLSSLGDRMRFLTPAKDGKADNPLHGDLRTLAGEIAGWIAEGLPAAPEAPERLRAKIAALKPEIKTFDSWDALLCANICARLKELADLWQDCLTLYRQLRGGAGTGQWQPALHHRAIAGASRHRDHGLMLFSAASVALATACASALWIASGWAGGATFVAMTAIACCFFGALDEPAPFIRSMVVWCGISQVGAGILVFVFLPLVHDFETLALVLAAPFLAVWAFNPRPELSRTTMLLAAFGVGSLSIQSRYTGQIVDFLDGTIATVGGLMLAWAWMLVTKPFGAEIAARRLLRSGWADLAAAAAGTHRGDHAMLVSRTLDRLGQLVPRLATGALGHAAIDGLRDLRVGYNVLDLQRDRRILPEPAKERIGAVLEGIAGHFSAQAKAGAPTALSVRLLDDLDAAIAAVLADGPALAADNALHALIGLRQALFPGAPPPASPPAQAASLPSLVAAE